MSASEKLKQLANATRLQKTDQVDDQEHPPTVKMSKAQRRKLRKQQKRSIAGPKRRPIAVGRKGDPTDFR